MMPLTRAIYLAAQNGSIRRLKTRTGFNIEIDLIAGLRLIPNNLGTAAETVRDAVWEER